jgi:hypothetical protein
VLVDVNLGPKWYWTKVIYCPYFFLPFFEFFFFTERTLNYYKSNRNSRTFKYCHNFHRFPFYSRHFSTLSNHVIVHSKITGKNYRTNEKRNEKLFNVLNKKNLRIAGGPKRFTMTTTMLNSYFFSLLSFYSFNRCE